MGSGQGVMKSVRVTGMPVYCAAEDDREPQNGACHAGQGVLAWDGVMGRDPFTQDLALTTCHGDHGDYFAGTLSACDEGLFPLRWRVPPVPTPIQLRLVLLQPNSG
jgi:hypothetical protein